MKTFYASDQAGHAPQRELFNGGFHAAAETPARLEAMLGVVGETLAPVRVPDEILMRVHDTAYIDFLQTAFSDWREAGRTGEAFPYVFPVVGRRPLTLDRIDAKLGRYAMDCGTPIGQGTWEAALGGASAAWAATEAVLGGDTRAFALCRPPGHHAGRDYLGGYSYLNNAAIAAETALRGGAQRVVILDVDYHHGNGSQDIFYDRDDVMFVSIHADPKTDYPFYWGHSDETGSGRGFGHTLNFPLARGTGWTAYRQALKAALEEVDGRQADLLIVSYGADTFDGDPISYFSIKTEEYTSMAHDISALGLPTIICMEGGYAIEHLGANLAAFLNGFSDAKFG